MRQTWMTGYLPLVWKDSITHMHGLAVYVNEGLPFAQYLSLGNSADSYLYFWLASLHSLSYFFFLYQPPFLSLCTIFDSFSSNFPTGIPGWDSHRLALLDLFISSDASICSIMNFPPFGNSDYVVVSVSIDFPSDSKLDAPISLYSLWLFLYWLGWSSWSFERCFMGRCL